MTITFESLRAQRPDLLDDAPAHAELVRLGNDRVAALGRIEIPDVALDGEVRVDLSPYQTPIRNQGSRGTCYAFAACAAMEAAYRRDHGVIVSLSPQYAFHVNKAFELFADFEVQPTWRYENNSSMWPFQGSSDMVEKLARAAVPTEAAVPYLSGAQMAALQAATPGTGGLDDQEELDALEWATGHIPLSGRTQASYRVKEWRALPANPSVEDIKRVLRAGHEVVADIPQHCYLIIGYDDTTSTFLVKNSWGEPGFITQAYSSPVLGGRYILEVEPPDAAPQRRAFWLGPWNVEHADWGGRLVIRRFTCFYQPDEEATKLGSYFRGGPAHDVHGTIALDGRSASLYIAEAPGRLPPGTPQGRRFIVHMADDGSHATGEAVIDGVPHPIVLTRETERRYPPFAPPGENVLPSFVYAIEPDGDLLLYRHEGARNGVHAWTGPRRVGWGWGGMTHVLPGGGDTLYAIDEAGDLQWYRHTGFSTGLDPTEGGWAGPRRVGNGWSGFARVIAGGDGVLYAIRHDGTLRWYRHHSVDAGEGVEVAGAWAAPRDVGTGWNGFLHVFSIGGGVIYAVRTDGTLVWYKHLGFTTGRAEWIGPKPIAPGWDAYTAVFGRDGGVLYAIAPDGDLMWFRHRGHADGRPSESPGAWEHGRVVGTGWGQFNGVFALLPRAPSPVR